LTTFEGRFEDAYLIAETCHKLDPENGQITDLANRLRQAKDQPNPVAQIQKEIVELEAAVRAKPSDYSNAFSLASKYMQIQQDARAFQILDGIADGSNAAAVYSVIQAYVQMQNLPKVEATLVKYVKLTPDQPDAWYNLAKTEAVMGKTSQAMEHLREAMKLNAAMLAKNPGWHDLRAEAQKDPSFASLHALPEYKTLISPP
jgi:thioredoxin-like negative regulator of GroEL